MDKAGAWEDEEEMVFCRKLLSQMSHNLCMLIDHDDSDSSLSQTVQPQFYLNRHLSHDLLCCLLPPEAASAFQSPPRQPSSQVSAPLSWNSQRRLYRRQTLFVGYFMLLIIVGFYDYFVGLFLGSTNLVRVMLMASSCRFCNFLSTKTAIRSRLDIFNSSCAMGKENEAMFL